MKNYSGFLKEKLTKENFEKLSALKNDAVINFVGECVELCNPSSVFVRTDSKEDIDYIRKKSLELGEEKNLGIKGHTYHFDGYYDQARDKENTRYLVSKADSSLSDLKTIDKEKGVQEVKGIMNNIMQDKEMFVCFFCLGPTNSKFSVLAMQITDSAYVGHSDDILYRPGYEQFKRSKVKNDFFKFVHSAGELENCVSKNVVQRRVYINLDDMLIYSANTQYAGNTVGLKKLALRLAIRKASQSDWLSEHMFLMSITDKGKKAYFAGAYPSMCGKTSTAMIPGEKIVGDDIVYIREIDGKAHAVNVERGIFGIIKGVNSKDDPLLFKALTTEGEVIFSNILVNNGIPYWLGMGIENVPEKGVNFSGEWFKGKKDAKGEEILLSHKNGRYTVSLKGLENLDENLENPEGVELSGIIYGGRDSDTSVPVEEALSWDQGILIKASCIESETTAATLGKEGVREFNPMSNMDFLSIPLSRYIEMNLEFGRKLKKQPKIFSVNYFIRDKSGNFLNDIQDKRVWLKWMRLKVENKCRALSTPTGSIPKYEDLKRLFKEVLGKDYKKESYVQQFTLRIPENLAKIKRIREIYKKYENVPRSLFKELDAQEKRLLECRKKFSDYVSPENFQEV